MPLPNAPAPGRNSGYVPGRRLKMDARNKKRRAAYVPTGNRPGRPRKYVGAQFVRARTGHVRYRTARTRNVTDNLKAWVY
jgi:hypothetical protein